MKTLKYAATERPPSSGMSSVVAIASFPYSNPVSVANQKRMTTTTTLNRDGLIAIQES
jgi:hypothetical protein